jgi:hypothetical protein
MATLCHGSATSPLQLVPWGRRRHGSATSLPPSFPQRGEARRDVPGGAPATAGRWGVRRDAGRWECGARFERRRLGDFFVRRRGAGLPNFCGAPTVSCETNRRLTRCGTPNVRLRQVRRRTKQPYSFTQSFT